MKSSLIFTFTLAAALVCIMPAAQATTGKIDQDIRVLQLSFQGLESLGEDFVYEGWLIAGGVPVSTGTFSVDMVGIAHPSSFVVDADTAAISMAFVLTIELADDPDPGPSHTHLLAGEFMDDEAMLSISHPAALDSDFSTAAGFYILNTPSTASTSDDYNQGIWFLDPAMGPGPSLTLPVLPEGWVYEGWVAGMSGPVTTGRFLMTDEADSDLGGPYAGPDGVPPFPGQDYITPPMVLTEGYAAVISVEPDPDNSAAPFTIKPLVDINIDDVGIGVPQDLMNNASSAPSGMASFVDMTAMKIDLTGVEPLGDDYVYEGWLIVSGMPVSTGTFTVDADGRTYPATFWVNTYDAEMAAAFVLTIEPAMDMDPAPSATHYLGGDFMYGEADLTISHPAALGDDFTSAMGGYILNTPSTASTDEDYDQGIWFLDPGMGPGPSLSLPELPPGWAYEGWVAGMSGPVTTGRFLYADEADFDLGGPYAGPDGVPPFPGQDYITPPMVLTEGYAAVISIEPDPDNSPNPFALKPLVDMNIDDVGIGVLQDMSNNASSFPMGYVLLGALEPCVNDGDVNDDLDLTPEDALISFQIYLQLIDPIYSEECAADCNGDGAVSPADGLCIFRHYMAGECQCVDSLPVADRKSDISPQNLTSRSSRTAGDITATSIRHRKSRQLELVVELTPKTSDVNALGFQVKYPQDLLKYTGAEISKEMASWTAADVQLNHGVLTVGAFDPDYAIIAGNQTEIVTLHFDLTSRISKASLKNAFSFFHFVDDIRGFKLVSKQGTSAVIR